MPSGTVNKPPKPSKSHFTPSSGHPIPEWIHAGECHPYLERAIHAVLRNGRGGQRLTLEAGAQLQDTLIRLYMALHETPLHMQTRKCPAPEA